MFLYVCVCVCVMDLAFDTENVQIQRGTLTFPLSTEGAGVKWITAVKNTTNYRRKVGMNKWTCVCEIVCDCGCVRERDKEKV